MLLMVICIAQAFTRHQYRDNYIIMPLLCTIYCGVSPICGEVESWLSQVNLFVNWSILISLGHHFAAVPFHRSMSDAIGEVQGQGESARSRRKCKVKEKVQDQGDIPGRVAYG